MAGVGWARLDGSGDAAVSNPRPFPASCSTPFLSVPLESTFPTKLAGLADGDGAGRGGTAHTSIARRAAVFAHCKTGAVQCSGLKVIPSPH